MVYTLSEIAERIRPIAEKYGLKQCSSSVPMPAEERFRENVKRERVKLYAAA